MAQQPPASLGVQRLQVKPFCCQLPSGSTELMDGALPHLPPLARHRRDTFGLGTPLPSCPRG